VPCQLAILTSLLDEIYQELLADVKPITTKKRHTDPKPLQAILTKMRQ
jgi:hypothetical protein